jgi:predicted secreted hydrolase
MAADFGIDLVMTDTRAAPVLHDTIGWIDFADAGSSYYYSRPRMTASGTVTVGDRAFEVTGEAWFDHQWGDFIAVGGGGWDWFAVNLDDGTDLTLSLVRAADGTYPLVYGTLVRMSGETVHLPSDAFTVTSVDTWQSPDTGAVYPSGWTISIPSEQLEISLTPTVLDQELDTRRTTGVIYWEGSQIVEATHAGEGVGGEGYVELTGYAP